MAQRRMFSLKVVDTDMFLDMSPTAQNLYFHLGMRADDDGFVSNPKKVMKICGAPEDDMKVLIAKGFIIPMATNGVAVITHWKVNNLIKSDRYTETIYREEKRRLDQLEDGRYGFTYKEINAPADNGSKSVPEVEPQVRLGKDRLGKDRLGKDRLGKATNTLATPSVAGDAVNQFIELFKEVNPSYKTLYKNTTQRKAVERMLEEHGEEKLRQIIAVLPKTNSMKYAPSITTPLKLEERFGDLLAFMKKEGGKNLVVKI